jgi:SAM-dependent methyltransferase
MLKAFADRGWEVVGLERSTEATAAAREAYGLPVFSGEVASLEAEPAFDLVVMFQVLEHMTHPAQVLRDCARVLKPRGTLVVSLPNFGSWQAQLFGSHWLHLDVPRHLVHFTPASLALALRRAGFEVERCGYISAHDPYGWIQSAFNMMGFRQNLLTDILMGGTRSPSAVAWALLMMAAGAVLLVPSIILSLVSGAFRRGAIMEVRARRV